MFRALVRKELDEHKWLALAGFACVMLLVALHLQPPQYGRLLYEDPRPVPVGIVSNSFLGIFNILCCFLGFSLGLMFSSKETTQKTWHFLIHRPASKESILAAKVVGGLVLYFFGAGIPALFLSAWSAIPGNYPAPFDIEYVFPAMEALVRGLLLFLALFMCGVEGVHGIANGFAYVAGLVAMGMIAALFRMWTTVAVVYVVAFFLLAGSIRAVFIPRKSSRPLTVAVLTLGFTLILLIIALFGQTLTRLSFWQEVHAGPVGESPIFFFSQDGEPRLWVVLQNATGTLETVDGKVVVDRFNAEAFQKSRLPRVGLFLPEYKVGGTCWCRELPVEQVRPDVYFLNKGGVFLVTSFGTPLYAGRNGFHTDKTAVLPFSRTARLAYPPLQLVAPPMAVCDEHGLYMLDISKLEIEQVFKDEVLAVGVSPKSSRLVLRGPDYIAACDLNGANAIRFPLPPAATQAKYLEVGFLPGDVLAVIAHSGGSIYEVIPSAFIAYKINSQGQVLCEHTIPRPPETRWKAPTWAGLVPGINPLSLSIFAGLDLAGSQLAYEQKKLLSKVRAPDLPEILLFCAKLLLCAAVIFVWTRKWGFSLGRALGWSLYALLAGIPAVLAIWVVFLDEKRVRCPSCGRKTPPSLERCHNCGAAWPAPARRDTDIFSTDDKTKTAAVGSGSASGS